MALAIVPAAATDTAAIEASVADALSRMTTEEKIGVIHAQSKFSS